MTRFLIETAGELVEVAYERCSAVERMVLKGLEKECQALIASIPPDSPSPPPKPGPRFTPSESERLQLARSGA